MSYGSWFSLHLSCNFILRMHARNHKESSIQPLIRDGYCLCRQKAARPLQLVEQSLIFSFFFSSHFHLSIGYVLCWEEAGQNETCVSQTLSNSTLTYKVTGLTSLTTYTLQVAAVTQAGTGAATSSTISTGLPPGLHTTTNTHFNASITLMHQILPWGSVIVTVFEL